MGEIDADFKVCFHGTIPQPDYSKPLASNLVSYVDTLLFPMPGNNPIILFQLLPNLQCDKLQPQESIFLKKNS